MSRKFFESDIGEQFIPYKERVFVLTKACYIDKIDLINFMGDDFMFCPRCGNQNCVEVREVHTQNGDFSAGKGCCGYLIFGPIGILCGLCGRKKETHENIYLQCNSCGLRFTN